MKKIIAFAFVMTLCLAVAVCAMAATPANVAEKGTGITVIPATDWATVYPDVYESYMANADNSEATDYVQDYPYIATVYEGMAFNTYYLSARGHYYTVQEITETGRPHKLANCWTCKTADFTVMTLNDGDSAYSLPFDDVLASVNEAVGCFTCHANDPSQGVTVTHTYLVDAMGDDFESVAAADASCGQCHVEYYFDPDTKATTLPYTSKASMNPDDMYEFYESTGFYDYENPRTGVKQLKAQHPEYETYTGEGSVHAGMFTCADCHMETVTKEDGTTYKSHYLTSPLQSETIMASCNTCHGDITAKVTEIQTAMEDRTNAIGLKLEELTNKLADAVASGDYTEEELDAIRALNRKGQWYWDFVFVENSEGAHNSTLDNSCLDKAEELIDQALGMFKS